VKKTSIQSHLPSHCCQLQGALPIAVWPSRAVRVAGIFLMSVADQIAQAAVPVIAVCHRWLVQDCTPKFPEILKKAMQVLYQELYYAALK